MAVKLAPGTRFARKTEPSHRSRLVVLVEALQKHGKSHFALTAPAPILYQDIEDGTEGVLDDFLEAGVEIWPALYQAPSGDVTVDSNVAQQEAVSEVNQFFNDYYAGLKSGARTIVWDTASELWEMIQLARFGKLVQNNKYDYRDINAMMKKAIRAAVASDVSLIMLHRLKKKYVNEKWNGEYEAEGYKGSPFEAQIVVRSERCNGGECGAAALGEDHPEGDANFHLKIIECRHNPELMGMDLPAPYNTFGQLASLVFGGTDSMGIISPEWE